MLMVLSNAMELLFADGALELHVIVYGLWRDGLVGGASVLVRLDDMGARAADVVVDGGTPGALICLDKLGCVKRSVMSSYGCCVHVELESLRRTKRTSANGAATGKELTLPMGFRRLGQPA